MDGDYDANEGARQAQAPQDARLKLKIAKKAYVFEVKKKFAATKSFNMKKKPETPMEDFKQALSMIFGKKQGDSSEAGRAKARAELQTATLVPKPMSPLVAGLGVVFLMFLFSAAYILVYLGSSVPYSPPTKPLVGFAGDLNYSIIESMILSSSETSKEGEKQSIAYFLVGYSGAGLSVLNFTSSLYTEQPPTQVFVLSHARESAYGYPIFRNRLSSRLSALGFEMNDIDSDSVRSLPQGAMLLVPTGYFPSELLEGKPALYKKLLERGVDIIYIGYPFDDVALDKSGATVKASNSDFGFISSRPESKSGFELYDSQYSVAGSSPIYGSVSVVHVGKGSMVFVPQTLDGGWIADGAMDGPQKAANDIARLLSERLWLSPFVGETITAIPSGEENRSVLSIFTGQFPGENGYVEFTADAVDQNGVKQRYVEVFGIKKPQLGDMSVRDSKAVPFFLSGQRTRLNLELRENNSKLVKLFVTMYKDGVKLQRSDLEYGLTNPTIEKSVDFQVDAPPGKYVVMTEDESGKAYAATELDVVDLDIKANSTNWNKGIFSFILSSAGRPINPSRLTLTFDGKSPREYSNANLQRTTTGSSLEYVYKDKIDSGTHTFAFSSGDWSKKIAIPYRKSTYFWENPVVLLMGAISLMIFFAGYFLRRSEAPRYGLDVPDFPPISSIKIPVKRETVLEIFDNVNLGYSWKWMPLRPEDIKNGFRKLTYNGKPILMGDFNLDRILSKLKEESLVKNELDYWGLSRWEKESGHSIRYLTLYRIMRNVFVNNAVKFSKLDAMPDCDLKAIAGKEEIYFHIMEEPADRVVHRALATAKKGTTMIVFKTQDEVDVFSSSLTSTSKLAIALKMEMQNKNIHLVQVKNSISAYLKQIAG